MREVVGVWVWGFSVCLMYVYSDVFLCSASIVHMSCISLDRYLGISQPLKTRNKSRTMIIIKICVVWIITVIISSPMAVLALVDHDNVLQGTTCVITNRYFMIYGSTLSFLIPFIIMAVTYVRTTNLLRQQAALLSQVRRVLVCMIQDQVVQRLAKRGRNNNTQDRKIDNKIQNNRWNGIFWKYTSSLQSFRAGHCMERNWDFQHHVLKIYCSWNFPNWLGM